MKKALLEVINFDVKDIITTSLIDKGEGDSGNIPGYPWPTGKSYNSPYGQ